MILTNYQHILLNKRATHYFYYLLFQLFFLKIILIFAMLVSQIFHFNSSMFKNYLKKKIKSFFNFISKI